MIKGADEKEFLPRSGHGDVPLGRRRASEFLDRPPENGKLLGGGADFQ